MVSIKTKEEIEKINIAGTVVYNVLELMKTSIKPGITTEKLNEIVDKYIRDNKCTPSFLNYDGYPKSVCISINDEVVHGIPGKRKIKTGDIVKVDVGACYKGYHADSARTYIVGKTTNEIKALVENTERALYKGLSVIKEGIKLNEVSKAIESVAKEKGYGVIRELTGHGIGTVVHEDPYIFNYDNDESELILKEGMTLAIEPMFSLKKRHIWMLEDGWTITTQDGSIAAHFEHTIAVTKEGYKILTGE